MARVCRSVVLTDGNEEVGVWHARGVGVGGFSSHAETSEEGDRNAHASVLTCT
jgi:hypothetical protein